jgi:hypothetical protein
MHGGNSHDRNPGCARPPNIKQALRVLQPIGQVLLCAAAASAFVLARRGAVQKKFLVSSSCVAAAFALR